MLISEPYSPDRRRALWGRLPPGQPRSGLGEAEFPAVSPSSLLLNPIRQRGAESCPALSQRWLAECPGPGSSLPELHRVSTAKPTNTCSDILEWDDWANSHSNTIVNATRMVSCAPSSFRLNTSKAASGEIVTLTFQNLTEGKVI